MPAHVVFRKNDFPKLCATKEKIRNQFRVVVKAITTQNAMRQNRAKSAKFDRFFGDNNYSPFALHIIGACMRKITKFLKSSSVIPQFQKTIFGFCIVETRMLSVKNSNNRH